MTKGIIEIYKGDLGRVKVSSKRSSSFNMSLRKCSE